MGNQQKSNKHTKQPTKIGPEQSQKTNTVIASYQATISSGPLPAPEVLERFNRVAPGAAQIIIDVFQQQAAHRQRIEAHAVEMQADNMKQHFELMRTHQRADYRLAVLGQVLAFLVSCGVIGGAVYCIMNGFAIAGTILGGLSLTTVVGTFIYGSRGASFKNQDQDNQNTLESTPSRSNE